MGNETRAETGTIDPAVLEALTKALREIEYGSVVLKIHQGQVVGIETSTKLRLNG